MEWETVKDLLKKEGMSIFHYPYGEYFRFCDERAEYLFYHSGVSKTTAAGACQYAIDTWESRFLFVLGTCGGVAEDLNPLDIVIAARTVHYDCRDAVGEGNDLFYSPMTVHLDNSWAAPYPDVIREGTIATADRDLCFDNLHVLRNEGVLAADWESGAIAKVCDLNRVRCCILRAVTDIPRSPGQDDRERQLRDYRENTPPAMGKLLHLFFTHFSRYMTGDPRP
jgi:nucleoside phosphorylase